MTLSPFFTDPQFLDANAPGGMNPAFATVLNAFESLASGVWASPGLLAPEAMSVAFSSTTGTIGLPQPFGIVSSGGVVLRAFGTNTGQSTTNYSVAFGSLIPGTGSITAYLAATISLIQENPFPIPGPPPGHPSYNPNFVPTIGYAQNVYSISLSAVTGAAPDNVNTFELFRTTLTAGQSSITNWSTAFQRRAPERGASPYALLTSGGVLSPSQSNSTLIFGASGVTVTLPPASGAAGLYFSFSNPLSVTGTVAATGTDVILGATNISGSSAAIPPSGSATFWANGPSGQYELVSSSVPFSQIQLQATNYGVDSGSVNALTVNLSPPPLSLASFIGAPIRVLVGNTNTGATTLKVNGLSATTASLPDGTALSSGIIASGGIADFMYDGSKFQLQNPLYLDAPNVWKQTQTYAHGIIASGTDAGGASLRFYSAASGYGAMWTTDNTNAYLLFTNNGTPLGSFNSLRPITVNLASGVIEFDGTGAGTGFGGPVTLPAPPSNDASNRAITSSWVYGAMQYVASVAGFAISLGANGYIKLPNWLGSLMMQWGNVTLGNGSSVFVSLPTTYPNAHLWAMASYGSVPALGEACGAAPGSPSVVLIGNATTSASNQIFFLSIGF